MDFFFYKQSNADEISRINSRLDRLLDEEDRKDTSNITEEQVIQQMIYALCQGDIRRREHIASTYTYLEGLQWVAIKMRIMHG